MLTSMYSLVAAMSPSQPQTSTSTSMTSSMPSLARARKSKLPLSARAFRKFSRSATCGPSPLMSSSCSSAMAMRTGASRVCILVDDLVHLTYVSQLSRRRSRPTMASTRRVARSATSSRSWRTTTRRRAVCIYSSSPEALSYPLAVSFCCTTCRGSCSFVRQVSVV